jgi:2-hydroxyacyl-CoA lyase 1
VKYAARIESIQQIPYFVEAALRATTYGRPGAAYLELPGNVITGTAVCDISKFRTTPPPPLCLADPNSIGEAISLLRSAQRPLIIIGKGAAYARVEAPLLEFVNGTGIPFLPTPMGKGVITDHHPSCVSAARTDALLHADVILLVGARLNWILHFGRPPRFSKTVKFIKVDIAPEEMSLSVAADVQLVGDANAVCHQLLSSFKQKPWRFPTNSPWWVELKEKMDKNRAGAEQMKNKHTIPMSYYEALHEVARFIPSDAIIVSEGANTMDIARSIVANALPRHRLDAGSFGTMGVGMGFAIAAAAVSPQHKVVSISGDSAFGFSGMEIETVCRYRLPITIVIINNNGIYSGLEQLDASLPPPPNCLLPDANYQKIVEAFGGKGYLARTPLEIAAAMEQAMAEKVPTIVNVLINPNSDRKPQKFDWLTRSSL